MAKRKCSFRMPEAVKLNSPYDLYAIDCDCGMRCLGRTKADAEGLWIAHINGEVR